MALLQEALLDAALDINQDDATDAQDGLSLCVAILQEAVNDFLKRRDDGILVIETDPELVTCACDPLCPLEAFYLHEIELDPSDFATCERMRQLRSLDDYPSEAWLTSKYEGAWSFRWICVQFQVDPEWLLSGIRRMPRGKAVRLDGRKLYKQSTASYDTRSQQLRRTLAAKERRQESRRRAVRTASRMGEMAGLFDLF